MSVSLKWTRMSYRVHVCTRSSIRTAPYRTVPCRAVPCEAGSVVKEPYIADCDRHYRRYPFGRYLYTAFGTCVNNLQGVIGCIQSEIYSLPFL